MSATKVLLLLSILFSSALADDKYGGFGCPKLKLSSNINTTDLAAYKTTFLSYFPLRLHVAGEDKKGREFSCMTWNDLGDDTIGMNFYDYDVVADEVVSDTGEYSETSISFEFKIPTKGLLAASRAGKKMTAHLVDDTGDYVIFKVCRGVFLAHYMSTYAFLKKDAHQDQYQWRCVVDAVDEAYNAETEPKGIC